MWTSLPLPLPPSPSPSPEVLAGLLLLAPLAGAVLVWLPRLLVARLAGPRRAGAERLAGRLQDWLTIGTSVASLGLVLAVAALVDEELRFHILFVELYLDSLSIYFLLLVSLVALAAASYAGPCWSRRSGTDTLSLALFHCLFNLFHFTMVLVPMVSNLVVLWIGIELTTVTSTLLIAAERNRVHFEAAWKYIIITSTGIIFALLGTLFLASAIPEGSSGGTSMSWPDLVQAAENLDPNLTRLSFLFVLIGYGTKAGFAPMHTWLPDAHGEAPYPVSALLSGVLLKSALYVILRFFQVTNLALGDGGVFTSRLLLGTGLLSLVTATPFILKRNPFKRVLAYHSLGHMGIITIGIGIGGPVALFGALLHVLNHGVTKSLMFLAYGNVQDAYPRAGPVAGGDEPDPTRRDQGRVGVLRAMPWTGSLLALGGFALVGSPPFSIFLSELLILWGALERILAGPAWWLIAAMVIFLLSVTLVFGGQVRHLSRTLLGSPPDGVRPETPRQVLPLVALLLVILLLGLVVPAAGPLDLRGLLDASVAILCEGGDCG
jgi:hydrogenase-4 component F